MKPFFLFSFALFSLALLPSISFSQYTYPNLQVGFLETAEKTSEYSFEHLRLYPIFAKESFKTKFASVGKYTSLQQAIAENKVKVTEKTNGGTVNTLVIENLSNDTILLVPGDLVKGGKQDRIIQQDLLLKPKSGKKDLSVYCVESGRWNEGNSRSLASRQAPAEFKDYQQKGSMSLRKVVEKDKDQGKVWSKVEELNKTNKTETATKTYNALSNSAEYNNKLQAYLKFFKNKFNDPSIIGVIVVSGDRVLGSDMFATHELFLMQLPSLLHSYASEAILNGKTVNIKPSTVQTFANRLLQDEGSQEMLIREKGNAFTEKSHKLRVSVFE